MQFHVVKIGYLKALTAVWFITTVVSAFVLVRVVFVFFVKLIIIYN